MNLAEYAYLAIERVEKCVGPEDGKEIISRLLHIRRKWWNMTERERAALGPDYEQKAIMKLEGYVTNLEQVTGTVPPGEKAKGFAEGTPKPENP